MSNLLNCLFFILLVFFSFLFTFFLATEKNVHLSLVIHPRKEQDDTLLNINSVFGTAKATQEADNVLILQRVDGNKLIDIRKNRFDGDLGRFQIMFNPDTHLYRDEMSSRDLKIGEFDGRVEGGDDVKEVVNNNNNENVVETDDLVMKEKEIESKRSSPVLDEIIMS